MRGRGTKDIRGELRELILKQTETLRAQTFGGLTAQEAEEYERRQKKIHELCVKFSGALQEEAQESKRDEHSAEDENLNLGRPLRRPA